MCCSGLECFHEEVFVKQSLIVKQHLIVLESSFTPEKFCILVHGPHGQLEAEQTLQLTNSLAGQRCREA